MKIDVLEDAQRGIKVSAKPLRHIGDAGNMCGAVCFISHIAVENCDTTFLNDPDAADQCQQGRFANSIRSYDPDHSAGWDLEVDIVKRKGFPIAMGHALNLGADEVVH